MRLLSWASVSATSKRIVLMGTPELIDQRSLAALRFVDATTGADVRRGLIVDIPRVRIIRNQSNLYVVVAALGLESHLSVFEQPPAAPTPDSLSFSGTVSDPSRSYLSRR